VSEVRIVEADLSDPAQAAHVVDLIDAYAREPIGGGTPLAEGARERLPAGLAAHPTSRIWLAYAGDAAVGVAVVFEGYSTFAAAPLLNIHDLAVLESHRGQGIGRRLLAAVEQAARARGCAKLTLEVVEKNQRAQGLYKSFGFEAGAPADTGVTFFYTKKLAG
jgi:ribosomal protein S18 acetylase RimI-like enzyme